MSSPFAQAHNSKNPIKILGDLNKDGKMSSYETTRQKGMEKGMEESKGSPAAQTYSEQSSTTTTYDKDGTPHHTYVGGSPKITKSISPPEKTYIKENNPTIYNEDGSVSGSQTIPSEITSRPSPSESYIKNMLKTASIGKPK